MVRDGRYVRPSQPGDSAQLHPASVAEFSYPDGSYWSAEVTPSEQGTGAA